MTVTEIIDGKRITLVEAEEETPFVVYCNSVNDGWTEILNQCHNMGCPPFHFCLISDLNWDEEMSPWPCEKVVSSRDHFTGQAPQYLKWMLETVVPRIEERISKNLSSEVLRNVLAGYSMAGLFALYAPYLTSKFEGVVSASGSVWFPDFAAFVEGHEMQKVPEALYLSIGDQESMTKKKYLSETVNLTKELYEYYLNKGIKTTFELNAGNHFKDYEWRLAKGIAWTLFILQKQEK
jgi:predicted alpha/beta superfamily hydrolase